MNQHKIVITMEGESIPMNATTVIITTQDNLSEVSDKLNAAFRVYDEEGGESYGIHRDYGWGIEGFIEYLKIRYRNEWAIELDKRDAVFNFTSVYY